MIVELVVEVVQQGVGLLIVLSIIYFLVVGVIYGVIKICEGLLLLWNQIEKFLHRILILPSHQSHHPHQYVNNRKAESTSFMEAAHNTSSSAATDDDVCSVCYESCATLFRCIDCRSARYCSEKCRIIHRSRRHEYEKKKGTDDEVVQRPADESRPFMKVERSNTVCFVCYSPCTTQCSRCKAVHYCSGKCQIIHWRQGHKNECFEKKQSKDDEVKRPADDGFKAEEAHEPQNDKQTSMSGDFNSFDFDWLSFPEDKFSLFMKSSSSSSSSSCTSVAEEGNTNPKPLIENFEGATKKEHEQYEERIRYLEEELAKYKNEVQQLRSERDKWERQTSFVSRRLHSLMREYDEHKIAEEGRVKERRKQDEHIHMLENECGKLKREVKEGKKLVQRLIAEKDDEIEVAKRKVQKISQELANAKREVEYAIGTADNARNERIMTKRELEEERELVKWLKLECEVTKHSAMRQVEEKELELANALKDVAATKAKLCDLEKQMKSSDDQSCAICLTNEKDMAFGCGHMTCADCGVTMSICPICRKHIISRLKLFPG